MSLNKSPVALRSLKRHCEPRFPQGEACLPAGRQSVCTGRTMIEGSGITIMISSGLLRDPRRDYCVIPLGGALHNKINPQRRFAPGSFKFLRVFKQA